ncbi:hypothetical protein [Streptomyces sp. 2P-4]|uniref:hypothetical protein n=1 Tax=Streptomyces sp. 2P-4 TaxID=2931974 RepID=UPI0025409AA2|nr:hypothetical protein [Streptomyces sp. 2P-4]
MTAHPPTPEQPPTPAGDPRPGTSAAPAAAAPGRFTGCGAALLAAAVLACLGLVGLHELERGIDGYGQLEETSGADGGVADPLAVGRTARYEDGLKVTVGAPRRGADGTHLITVTYRNDTDGEQRIGGDSAETAVSEYGEAPLVVRAGRSLDRHTSGGVRWSNRGESAAALLPPLAEDGKRTVPVRLTADRTGTTVTVEVRPPDDGYREAAYWEFTLD